MAAYFGKITPVTGTTVTVTGIPFEPVAVIFFGVHNPGTTISQCFGAASGSGEQWAMWTGMRQQTSGYLERHRELRDDHCIYLYNTVNHTVVQSAGTLSAFTSDGFSVAFTGAGSTQPIFYMAIGGRNITAAHAGIFTAGASTGTTAVTGPGFRPRALIVAHLLTDVLNTQAGFMCWGLGFTDGENQFSSFALGTPGSATAGNHIQRTDAIACGHNSGEGIYVAELESFDDDGFTVDVTDAWVRDNDHGYLAIEAAGAAVGFAEFPDSTGVVSYATPGLEPGGVLFGWNGADSPSSAGSSTMPVRPGCGGMDGVTVFPTKEPHGSISGLHRASAPFGAYQPLQTWRSDGAAHIRGAGSQVDPDATTLFSLGEFNLFEMGAFELDWTTASSNSREFGWLALPGEVQPNWVPHIYRRLR